MADVFHRGQRCYPQIQSAYDTIPNITGAATVANADCCLISALSTEPDVAEIKRPDKTGTVDSVPAQAGRRISKFSASMSAAANGAAGTPPDCKNFLQGIFGVAGAVVSSTSVTWSLADTLYYLAIWHFLHGIANATQMCAFNALVQKMEATFGGDTPMLTFSGENSWTIDNDQQADSANTPAAALGGLTAWPTEPSAPVVNGVPPQGFKVSAVIDGNSFTNILSGSAALSFMHELAKDTNSEFAAAGVLGDREATLNLTMADNDSASLSSLKKKSFSRTPVNGVITVGTVAGNRWVHSFNNLIMPKPKYGEQGSRRTVSFNNAIAYPSSINAKDQYTLAIT